MSSIANRLTELRKSRTLHQKDVAEAIGISIATYQRYEYGERLPNSDVIISLANFFNVSTDYLLGVDEKQIMKTDNSHNFVLQNKENNFLQEQIDMEKMLEILAEKNIELYFKFNSALQQKKNLLRSALNQKYKPNKLSFDSDMFYNCLKSSLDKCNLELKLDIIDEITQLFEHREDCYYVNSKIKIYIMDCETGFFESSIIESESFSELNFNNARKINNKEAIIYYFSSILF